MTIEWEHHAETDDNFESWVWNGLRVLRKYDFQGREMEYRWEPGIQCTFRVTAADYSGNSIPLVATTVEEALAEATPAWVAHQLTQGVTS